MMMISSVLVLFIPAAVSLVYQYSIALASGLDVSTTALAATADVDSMSCNTPQASTMVVEWDKNRNYCLNLVLITGTGGQTRKDWIRQPCRMHSSGHYSRVQRNIRREWVIFRHWYPREATWLWLKWAPRLWRRKCVRIISYGERFVDDIKVDPVTCFNFRLLHPRCHVWQVRFYSPYPTITPAYASIYWLGIWLLLLVVSPSCANTRCLFGTILEIVTACQCARFYLLISLRNINIRTIPM